MSANTGSRLCGLTLYMAAILGFAATASAQETAAGNNAADGSAKAAPTANDLAQANNPLANFTAFNLHNYYIGELTNPDKDADQFWMRFATPFSLGDTNWLMRASLPVNVYPVPPSLDHETGVSDLNVFAADLIDVGNPSLAFGIGRRSPHRPPPITHWAARSGPRGW